jgi:hypothetical protein
MLSIRRIDWPTSRSKAAGYSAGKEAMGAAKFDRRLSAPVPRKTQDQETSKPSTC